MCLPSGEKDALQSESFFALSLPIGAQLAGSQSRAVESSETVIARRPSGENAVWRIAAVWPLSSQIGAPDAASQIHASS